MDLIAKYDEEREHIAYELYHYACQTIYSMILGIKMVIPLEMDERLRNHLLTIEQTSTESLHKLRDLAFNLYPIMIKDLGFLPTLRSFIKKYNVDNPFLVKLNTSGDMHKLPIEQEVLLYRICSECITYFHKFQIVHMNLFIEVNDRQIIIMFNNEFRENINENLLIQSLFFTQKRIEGYNGFLEISQPITNYVDVTITIPIVR